VSEPRCERSELLVSQCAHCKGLDKAETFEYVVEQKMLAKYPGACSACGDRVIPGETTIGLSEDGWVCEGCFR